MWGGQNNEKLFTKSINFKMLLLLLDIIIHLIRQVVKTMFANLGWGSLGCRFACEGVPGRKKVEDPIQLVYRKNLSTLPHLSSLSPFLKSFYFCSSLSLYPSTPWAVAQSTRLHCLCISLYSSPTVWPSSSCLSISLCPVPYIGVYPPTVSYAGVYVWRLCPVNPLTLVCFG